jgi:hypothetical protein
VLPPRPKTQVITISPARHDLAQLHHGSTVEEEAPMARAKRLGSARSGTGLAIEYVRKRKVVRLLGWVAQEPIEPVEIPIGDLCRGLGIVPADLGAPHLFLLFAGPHRRAEGGLRDLIGTFDVEDDAWAAFRDLRQAHPAGQGWAELATIDPYGHVSQLAWFGLHPTDPLDDAPVSRRPVRRRVASSAYLRAVTPS